MKKESRLSFTGSAASRSEVASDWYDVALGTSDAHIAINLVNKDGNIVVEVYINDNKELFDALYGSREEIESQLGFDLAWDRLDNKKASRIKHTIPGLNFDDHSNYDMLMNQIIDIAVKMRDVLKKYL